MKDVVIIYGPTAVGKSNIAVEVAKMLNGEIISCDSMQIYKGLNVGTAKITQQEMSGIKHHLIDIKELNQDYSVSDFTADATICIENIVKKGKTPIIVGGTGLYIKALVDGYNFGETQKNEEFRNSLISFTNEQIYNQIISLDPNFKIDEHNRQRLIRAYERLKFGSDISCKKSEKYNFKIFAISDDRQEIYKRINARVDKMVKQGILGEVEYILNLNLKSDALCLKAIGYKELFPYIKKEKSLDECLDILKQKTRNYAKRQFTFMNQFKNLTVVNFSGIRQTAEQIVKLLGENNG